MDGLTLKKTLVSWQASVFYFFVLIIIDQAAKYLARNIFRNANFAFSLPLPVWLMYAIYFAVLLAMVIYLLKNYQRLGIFQAAAWLLIFAGAISNISERICLGYVRDFIYIHFARWVGVYNLADGYIIVGIILLLLSPAFINDKNNKNEQK